MIFRIISGIAGLTILVGTVVLALNLLARDADAKVILAGYMGIGGLLFSAYLLFYAVTGEWRPNVAKKNE